MKYHWLRDKDTQKMIKVIWDRGENNLADLYTKHHLIKYHRDFRIRNGRIMRDAPNESKLIVRPQSKDRDARGCVETSQDLPLYESQLATTDKNPTEQTTIQKTQKCPTLILTS